MFRREWRQHVLVAALLTAGTGAAVFASTAAFNVARPTEGLFGSAQYRLEVTVAKPELLDEYLAAAREQFGPIEVISRSSASVPGSVDTVEVRSQDPNGRYGAPMLRVLTGRYPQTADEVAVTDDASRLFGASVGDGIPVGNERPVVVGIIENPGDLLDEFVLTTSSTGQSPERVTVLFDAGEDAIDAFLRPAIEPGPLFIDDAGGSDKTVYAVLVLTIATIGMLLVGLVASAGFVVIAQRRQRQLGMLAAIGATPRHLRVVVLTNGALAGMVAAATGIVLGLGAWILFAPAFEGMAGHRISRFDLPWWLIAAGFALAVATATASAWWPARMVARVPIVNALSARPPRRVGAHRSALAAVLLLAIGVVCLGLGVDPTRDHVTVYLLIAGVVAMVAAVVLMASPGITVIAARAGGMPVAVRLAVRDLARNRARSGAALSAITVGLAIAVSVVVVTAAAEYGLAEGNLSDRQLIAWVGDTRPDIMVPDRSRA
ncbi:MAG TPA: FtsX-like permease family protein, partial [Actinomycetota bacterium]|nr:FtsX-like permease family protein [Actinomycetota bacterium]